jgi:hypothetical protein
MPPAMEFFNNRGRVLRTLVDWQCLAPPAAKHHWAVGRSAMELARDWLEGDAAARTAALLRTRPELAGLTLRDGIAEKLTRFDEIRGGPRHHDLLIHGSTSSGPLIVGVEGKADESFDLTLRDYVANALRRRPETTRAPERLDRLTTTFFGAVLDDAPGLGDLRYQLLSALAGTLADAKLEGARHAVLLVHEFVTDRTSDALHEENGAALRAFVERLGLEPAGDPDAWITGARVIRGDGGWLPAEMPVFVAKLVTRRRG